MAAVLLRAATGCSTIVMARAPSCSTWGDAACAACCTRAAVTLALTRKRSRRAQNSLSLWERVGVRAARVQQAAHAASPQVEQLGARAMTVIEHAVAARRKPTTSERL